MVLSGMNNVQSATKINYVTVAGKFNDHQSSNFSGRIQVNSKWGWA